ncbi:MAG: class I SAM-dependent methyltransferase [Myxococcota bacterium]
MEWLDEYPAEGRALDVGCGYGYNAAELQRRGLEVVGFDVSPAAISRAKVIHPRLSLEVANAVGLSDAWKSSFDLVVEIYTLQVLPPALRARVARSLRDCVAPGGRLLIVARGRDEHDPEGAMPWPLTRRELEELENESFTLASFRDFMDDEDPPVRRFVAELVRASE